MSAELNEALRELLRQNIGDYVYDVRERELMGWEGPKVKAWSHACEVVRKHIESVDALKGAEK